MWQYKSVCRSVLYCNILNSINIYSTSMQCTVLTLWYCAVLDGRMVNKPYSNKYPLIRIRNNLFHLTILHKYHILNEPEFSSATLEATWFISRSPYYTSRVRPIIGWADILADILTDTDISVSANPISVSAYQYRYRLSATWISAISVSAEYRLKKMDIGQNIGKYRYLGMILAKYFG